MCLRSGKKIGKTRCPIRNTGVNRVEALARAVKVNVIEFTLRAQRRRRLR